MKRDHAQALVEFALAFPVLLVLLVAVIEFGRLTFTYLSYANDTHEMARQASIPSRSDAEVIAAFNNLDVLTVNPNPATDSLSLTVYNAASVQQGSSRTCTLPASVASCSGAFPARTGLTGGYVEIGVTYVFVFGPRFNGPLGSGFVVPNVTLSLRTRDYIG